ncbi:MAG TPA: hypothetical protein PKD27_00180 [Tepidiformaceae bacterium]|nr:hypothetical protein [Tepidiformaceae bacterium]
MLILRMRLPLLLAAIGLAGIVAAMAASTSRADGDTFVYRAFVPSLAGDSAEGFSTFATSTPSPSPTPVSFGCAGPRSAIRTLAYGRIIGSRATAPPPSFDMHGIVTTVSIRASYLRTRKTPKRLL